MGGSKPVDYSWQGEEATISIVTTVFDYGIVQACMNRPNELGTLGMNNASDMGSLMQLEGLTYPLWIVYPYAPGGPSWTTPKAAYAAMPPGRRYVSTFLWSPYRLTPGTKPKRLNLIFKAMRKWSTQNLTFTLFDQDLTNLPAPVIAL